MCCLNINNNTISMDLKKSKISPKMGLRQKLLFDKLKHFYFNKTEYIDKLLPILNGNTKVSLRIIDWFVTNYSKKNNIILNNYCDKNDKVLQFNIFLKYKSQLKAFSKKQFDPFCRRERINFYYNSDKYIITTIGQLNFFRWALENKVLDYIEENLNDIEIDMNTNIKKEKKSKRKSNEYHFSDSKKRKKRRELSNSATKTMNKHSFNVTLSFE